MENITLSDNETGITKIDIEGAVKNFQDTTRDERSNKIVDDSFITFTNFGNNPTFKLVNVKDGEIDMKIQISEKDAIEIIEKCHLTIDRNLPSPFKTSTTWRTVKGCQTVSELLSAA